VRGWWLKRVVSRWNQWECQLPLIRLGESESERIVRGWRRRREAYTGRNACDGIGLDNSEFSQTNFLLRPCSGHETRRLTNCALTAPWYAYSARVNMCQKQRLLVRDAMLPRYILSSCVCLCVCQTSRYCVKNHWPWMTSKVTLRLQGFLNAVRRILW